ncbi:sigma-70 family RNA polymerase sigma factor [Rhizobium tubonense]|uniref:RNA polymerase sigma factor n=1 Tax=Rhizobium tubonense TaxID=484088 RepID=A0A2W4CB94_9HYPH|nr:sigma-70 family RNA polymerase sigma factor [Rhizobium tubonense]PZM10577.1 RNA polymerase subunit sigma-24 [Rhizobium tubonense]
MTSVETAFTFQFNGRLFPLCDQPSTRSSGIRFQLHTFVAAVRGLAATVVEVRAASEPRQAAALTSAQGASTHRFQQTIMPHLDSAYNFARFLSRDADAAQDIVQDAFLRAFRSYEGYRGGDPRAWLFTIVRNCYHAWLQQRRRKARLEVPLSDGADDGDAGTPIGHEIASDEDSAETTMIRDTEAQRVRAVINTLPEAMREVLILRELEDLSYRQIAEVIDAPIGTVMSRLARARRDFGQAWLAAETCGATV